MKPITMFGLLSLIIGGCASPAEPPATEHAQSTKAAITNAPAGAPGYVHNISASRFHLGAGGHTLTEFDLQKVVGSEGTFATDPRTGAVRAILNGDAPAGSVPALTNNPDVHNARVKTYFLNAGLPSDQMGTPQAMASMESHGPSSTPESQRTPVFVAYTTVVPRTIQGVPVPDSFAAARFNQNDETTMEWVYWPPIPQAVIDAAVALKAQLADPTARATFLATLPSEVSGAPAQVSIRHSDFGDPNFVAFASYDVQDGVRPGRARGGNRNFGADGKEIMHPNLRPNDIPVPSSVRFKP